MELSQSWARNRGKFSGDDFNLQADRTLQCPAGHSMYRRETRQNRRGDLLIIFGMNPRTCQSCPLRDQCLAEGSKGTGGRRVTVIRKKLAPSSEPLDANAPPITVAESSPSPSCYPPVATAPHPTAPPLTLPLLPQAQANSLCEFPLPAAAANLPGVWWDFPLPTPLSGFPPFPPLNLPVAPLATPTPPPPINRPPLPHAQPNAVSEGPLSPPPSPASALLNLPVVWLDFPTTRLRRDLSHQLQMQRIVIQPVTLDSLTPEPTLETMTRDQRAHRRLSWKQRWNKNASAQAILHWRVQLFGISSAVLEWLDLLKPTAAVIT